MMTRPSNNLPPHVESTILDISEVHEEYHRRARPLQKLANAITGTVARPGFLLLLTALVATWIGANVVLSSHGHRAPDPPPFSILSCAASVAALYLAAMILATQKHDDEMALHRDQLTLELAILSEQKSAKIIRLLEELRLNDPDQGDHADEEAQAMAVPADPKAVLNKIRATQAAMRSDG
jgi:uncharacterized membrane protein